MSGQQEEQSFKILPHPAETNDPKDLQGSKGSFDATQARPPHTLSDDQQKSLGEQQVLSGDDYKKRAEELNK